MENAYIHIGTSTSVGSFVVSKIITRLIDLSICVDIDGAVASTPGHALQCP